MSGFRKFSRTPKDVGSILERTLGSYRLDKKVKEYSAFPDWENVVGEEIANVAIPEKILKGRVLVLRVLDAAWAQELSMMKADILEKIFKSKMSSTIDDIRFVTGNPKSFKK